MDFRVERLECRTLLAGQVSATLRGNLLDLQGDSAGNSVVVRELGDVWHIEAGDGTTVIHGDTVVSGIRRLRYRGGGGNDHVVLDGLSLGGPVQLIGGPGNLHVVLDHVEIGGNLTTRVTGGEDQLEMVGGSSIAGNLIRITRRGDSTTELSESSHIQGQLRIVTDRDAAVEVQASSDSSIGRILGNAPRLLRNQVYSVADGTRLLADVQIPRSAGPHPAVLLIHGGYWRFGDKANMRAQADYLASRGYTVVSINYRLAPASIFPAQIYDAKAAVRWMREHADQLQIDPTRIAAYGYSAGAQLALLLGVTEPSDGLEGPAGTSGTDASVQAVIAGGAPVDFRDRAPNSDELGYYLGGTPAEVPDAYRDASPLYWVSPGDAPTMFYFGTLDFVVDTSNAIRMYNALHAADVDAEFHWLNFATHITAAADRRALEHVADFLGEHLA